MGYQVLLRPLASSTILVGEARGKRIESNLVKSLLLLPQSDMRIFVTWRFLFVRFHKPSSITEQMKIKKPFRGGMAYIGYENHPSRSPLVQALAPRTVRGPMASATLSKPLSRECLVNLFGKRLSKLPGSGLFVSREPHLPRIRITKKSYNTSRQSCQEKDNNKHP